MRVCITYRYTFLIISLSVDEITLKILAFGKVIGKVVTRWESEEVSGITHSYSKHQFTLPNFANDAMNHNNSKGRHKTLSSNKGELP